MSSATYRAIKSTNSTLPASKSNASKTGDSGQLFQSHANSVANKNTELKKKPRINDTLSTTRAKTSADEDSYDKSYPASQFVDSLIEKPGVSDIKNRHYFLKFAIPTALSFWLFDSLIHYYWYDELKFEIIPSDANDLWMRISIFLLLITFSLFADYKLKKSLNRSIKKNQLNNISRAKKQWEMVIDTLPQLVIAMDDNARITRVNRTVETWGIGKVNKVDGIYVLDFLKCLNDNCADDSWTSNWPSIWQQIKNQGTIVKKVEKEHISRTYQYTLKKAYDYDFSNDHCYAVLIIDDITARQAVEKSLKSHATGLEQLVNNRTKELKHANSQLEHELQAKKETNKKLKESQNCRLALLREIFTTQEKERKRIACELHDSVGQSLGATKFKLEELLIRKQDIFNADYDEFTDVVKSLQFIIQEIRHISMDLRPAMLDDLGILVTLNWFCREFGNTYTNLSIKKIINADESNISEDNKVVIFRIIQEAMNNIVKHANATNITIELSHSDAGLTISISDDGCGFKKHKSNKDNDAPKCHFGLSSMRERAESTNGDFFIETIPNVGTRISVFWEN